MTKTSGINILTDRLPKESIDLVMKWLDSNPIQIRISRPRNTKLGDFRPPHNTKPARISINSDLHPVEFLLTLAHELAHCENWQRNGRNVKPHGQEWKNIYRIKLQEIIEAGFLEQKYDEAIIMCFFKREKLATSSCPILRRLFDAENLKSSLVRLEDIPEGSVFTTTNNKIFVKGKKRRSRYSCRELKSRKMYTVHAMAEIVEFKPPKL